ncbi:MAG: energy transducer TonB [Candidatus Omnitrophica bacterium]|nr:energy transducer TonB [Candidatus Omnitrophota bacterium]
MRIPFSYKQNFFRPVLASVVLLHAGIFVFGGLRASEVLYDANRAPVSIDLVITEPIPQTKPVPMRDRNEILTQKTDERIEIEEVRPEESTPAKEIQDILPNPVEPGIRREAKPMITVNRPPIYPRVARQNGWEGEVLLYVRVDRTGKPIVVKVAKSSGHQVLDRAAWEAVHKWVFEPASLAGISLESEVKIPVLFTLKDDQSSKSNRGR